MPTKEKSEFGVFAAEVRHVHATWTIWRRLFNKLDGDYPSLQAWMEAGNEAYRVTGTTSKTVFIYVRWHLLRGVVVDICRLLDAKEVCGRPNLTVERILEVTDFVASPSAGHVARNHAEHLSEIAAKPHGLRALRNKSLAHHDLDVALDRAPFPDVDIGTIDLAVRVLVEFTHVVDRARRGAAFDISSPRSREDLSEEETWRKEADRLIATLASGLAATRTESETGFGQSRSVAR